MQSLPLLDMMSEQAARQRADLLAQAQDEAKAIRERAHAEAAARREEALRLAEEEFRAEAQRAQERADAEAHLVVLTTKDKITDEIMAEVLAELRKETAGPNFPRILEALLEELLRDAPAEVVVLTPPAHLEHCREWMEKHGHGSRPIEPLARLRDGVAIQDPERSYRITNTLTTRFQRNEGALRKLCQRRLFGKEAEA